MKRFLETYLAFFIVLPLLFCIMLYLICCFASWSIIELNIDWRLIRLYLSIAFVCTFLMTVDE